MERGRRSGAAATATCLVSAHVASAHPTREAVLERRDLERHRHLRQVVLSHVAELPKLAQLHQIEAIAARRLSKVARARYLAHRVGGSIEASDAIHLEQVVEVGLVKAAGCRSLRI